MRKTVPALTSRRPLIAIYPRGASPHHGWIETVVVHVVIEARAHGSNTCGTKLRGLALLAHAVDLWPKALLEPADLAENFFAARHLFFAVARGGDVCELVDEGARRVDKFVERGRRPVGDEGLVKCDNVGVGAGCGEG
jgi:hypothetical protein